MLGLNKVALAGAAVAFALFSVPANAVTIIDGGTYALTAPTSYFAGDGFVPFDLLASPTPGSFSRVYNFTYTGGSGVASSAVSVTTNDGGISPFQLDWTEGPGLGSSLILGPVTVSGTSFSINLPIDNLPGAHLFHLILTGSVGPDDGQFTQTLTTTATPLPAAAVLFGTVLVGGAGLLRRRRKVASSAVCA